MDELFVDVHSHLTDKAFSDILPEVMKRAESAGVRTVITNGLGPDDNFKQIELSKKYKQVKPALGLYPTETYSSNLKKTIEFILENEKQIIAIGEIGLDKKDAPDGSLWKKQTIAFEKMLELASELKKPVLIHSRRAEKDVFEIVKKYDGLKVIMHCFGGKMSLVKEGLERGYYFSIPAIINKSTHFRALVGIADTSHLLTETDAPYLSPNERINEPMNVRLTVEEIAKIKGLDKKEASSIIFSNFLKIF